MQYFFGGVVVGAVLAAIGIILYVFTPAEDGDAVKEKKPTDSVYRNARLEIELNKPGGCLKSSVMVVILQRIVDKNIDEGYMDNGEYTVKAVVDLQFFKKENS